MQIATTEIGELKIEGYAGDYVFETIDKNKDFYEKDILEKWTPYFGNCKTILDIGANLGNHTLYWAKEIPNVNIYSFEPCDLTFERLKRNVEINNLNNIRLYHKGVGEEKGFAHISHMDESNMGATTLECDSKADEGEIEIVDIDSMVKNEEILLPVDFIKIDTEGFEEKVFKGMEHVLATMMPDIWVELGEDTCVEILNRMRGLDYIVADIEGANILFLAAKRHPDIENIAYESIVQKMYYYLQRTNHYYGLFLSVREKYTSALNNYEVAKQWRANLEIKNNTLNEKVNRLLKENKDLSIKLDGLQKEKIQYLEKTGEYYNYLYEEEMVLSDIVQYIRQMELQNGQLLEENLGYKRKIEKVKSTLWGKIAYKIYRLMKKVRGKLGGK